MAQVWWINHSETYEQESNAGIIYSGYEDGPGDDHASRRRVEEMSPGDITVHSPPSCVCAVGRVQSLDMKGGVSFREDEGRVADVEYHEFPTPIDYQTLASKIYSRDVSLGPIHEPSGGTHGLQEGYCHYFSHEALAVVRELAGSWPAWPQARFPTDTQVAVDSEEGGERSQTPSAPQRKEHEVSRIIRDSQLARQVKRQTDYQCQVCGTEPIELPGGTVYAEAHHLHPLSEGGSDKKENIICVCPTCHVKLDYRAQELDVETFNEGNGSNVARECVEYHNERV